jgi:preprotein translocase subunit YajC
MISTILFLAQQTPPQGAPAQGGPVDLIAQLAPLLFIMVLFYFVLIRPQQKRQKQHQQLISNLKTGDKVITSAGIHGLIANVKETTVLLKIADNVKIEVDRSAIATVAKATESKPA